MISDTQPVIGLISGANFSTEREFAHYFNQKATVITQTIIPQKFSYADFEYVLAELNNAALRLMAYKPDALAFASMSITCLHGDKIVNQLEQKFGVPVLVTAQASVQSLRELDCRRISVLSPFSAALNLLERCYFDRNGIEVLQFLNLFGLQNEDTAIATNIREEHLLSCLPQRLSAVDALFFDSPTFPASFELSNFKRVTSIPVLTSNWALAHTVSYRLELE